MTEPIFWLAGSLVLVAVCLTAVLVVAIPAFKELARASRSAEKLFDLLYRDLPPTLEAIRLTGIEITDLTDDLSSGVVRAGSIVQQVDQGLQVAQRQAKEVGITTQSLWVGAKAIFKSLVNPKPNRRRSYGRSASAYSRMGDSQGGDSQRGDRPSSRERMHSGRPSEPSLPPAAPDSPPPLAPSEDP